MGRAKKKYYLSIFRSRIIGICGGMLVCISVMYKPVSESCCYRDVLFVSGFVLMILAFFDAWWISKSGRLSKIIDEMKSEENSTNSIKQPWER